MQLIFDVLFNIFVQFVYYNIGTHDGNFRMQMLVQVEPQDGRLEFVRETDRK